jgi:hypothetical protein
MEQIIKSRFFDYAIKDKAFTKNFDSYSSKFPEDIQQLKFYLDNSFLDPYSRVFLLIKMHEQFIKKHKKLLLKKERHIKSVFYELLQTPLSIPPFKYSIKSIDDVIVLLNIIMILKVDKQLTLIIERTNLCKILLGYNQTLNKYPVLINNFDLLSLSPFMLNPLKLKELLTHDISNINKDIPEHEFYEGGTDAQIVMSTIDSIYNEINTRINSNIFRNYYLNGYYQDIVDKNQLGIEHINNLHFDSLYEQIISKEFDDNFLKATEISKLVSLLDIDISKILSVNSEEKQNEIFLTSEKLKKSIYSKIKINTTFKLANSIFKKYFELSLPNNRYKVIYPNFRYFLKELFNNDIITKDLKKVELDELEVRNLIGFFSEYKSTNAATNLFTYEVLNLISFIEHITGLDAKISAWDRAHRDKKGKPNKDCKREINTILDQYPRDKKW